LMKVRDNNLPLVSIESREPSVQVTASGVVNVSVEIVDDTLYHGTEVRLYVDDSQADLKRITFDEIETEFSEKEEYKLPERFKGSLDRKSTRLNSSHVKISYAVFCLKKKKGPTRSREP